MNKLTVVISNYQPRGSKLAESLIREIKPYVSQIIVVQNIDHQDCVAVETQSDLTVIKRPNTGMNIGAWSEAIPFCIDGNNTLFLQDECRLVDASFFEAYTRLLAKPEMGMVGETINPNWDKSWEDIYTSNVNYRVPLSGSLTSSRLDYYRYCFRKWKVPPGNTGRHLRALAWGFPFTVLEKLGRFPIGQNKEQCIAAEIAVSLKVSSLGFHITQSADKPFTYFEHIEWQKDGSGKHSEPKI